MEKEVRRIDRKKVAVNILIVLFILVGAFVFCYSAYIVNRLDGPIKTYEDLTGRMYGNLDDDYYVLFEKNAVTISEDDTDTVYTNVTFSDNILTVYVQDTIVAGDEERTEERTLTFVFLRDERFFYADKNKYLDLMWETIDE